MQVKCDFCGSFMEDNEYSCPNCGATNAHMKRTAPQTPKTIEELKNWYEERNLPPYETTRFFIGIDYKEPKAFGIYKDGMSYIVYKNKADGTRAIRYSGNDEAYAVNELYLRLKEEILNQKNHQVRNATGSESPLRSTGASDNSGCLGISKKALIWLGGAALLFGLSVLGTKAINSLHPQYCSYYAVDDNAYYFAGYAGETESYEWWEYNPVEETWDIFSLEGDDRTFPNGITHKDYRDTVQDLADSISYSYESVSVLSGESPLNVRNSRLYKDRFHFAPTESSYYVVDGRSYYYLNDRHGNDYGNGDNSGWYTYDNGWEYYCDTDDKEALGDGLWYDPDKYALGSTYNDYIAGSVYYYNQSDTWNTEYYASDFGNTTWYQEYEAATEAYNAEQAAQNASSSVDDSNWDWSSSDSWDSGSTDWGSDW